MKLRIELELDGYPSGVLPFPGGDVDASAMRSEPRTPTTLTNQAHVDRLVEAAVAVLGDDSDEAWENLRGATAPFMPRCKSCDHPRTDHPDAEDCVHRGESGLLDCLCNKYQPKE